MLGRCLARASMQTASRGLDVLGMGRCCWADSLPQISCSPEPDSKLRTEGLRVGRGDPHGTCEL